MNSRTYALESLRKEAAGQDLKRFPLLKGAKATEAVARGREEKATL